MMYVWADGRADVRGEVDGALRHHMSPMDVGDVIRLGDMDT